MYLSGNAKKKVFSFPNFITVIVVLLRSPEESKSRKDMFYLLPDPSCAPDSPVWYSSQPVPREILARMLRRVLLVEEVLHNLCALD
jgi:hypothetical protein